MSKFLSVQEGAGAKSVGRRCSGGWFYGRFDLLADRGPDYGYVRIGRLFASRSKQTDADSSQRPAEGARRDSEIEVVSPAEYRRVTGELADLKAKLRELGE